MHKKLKCVHHLVLLLQLGDHDDDGRLLLPGHLPEVVNRVDHRTLCGNEGFLMSEVTLRSEEQAKLSNKGNDLMSWWH